MKFYTIVSKTQFDKMPNFLFEEGVEVDCVSASYEKIASKMDEVFESVRENPNITSCNHTVSGELNFIEFTERMESFDSTVLTVTGRFEVQIAEEL